MTPFNLEKAKKGLPMKTRSGHKAKFLALLNGGQPAPLVVEVMIKPKGPNGNYIEATCVENYYTTGRHGTVHNSPLDLFMTDDFS